MKRLRVYAAGLIRSRIINWTLGILLSVVALYLSLRGVNLHTVWISLAGARAEYILLALVSVAVNTFVKAIRWKALIDRPGKSIGLLQSFNALVVAQMLNTIFPVRIGDIGRAYFVGNGILSKTFILGTVALEKIIDMVMYLLLFALLLLLMPVPNWVSQPVLPFALVAIITFAATLLVTCYQSQLLGMLTTLTSRLPGPLHKRFTNLADSALASLNVLQNWRSSLWISLWSVVIWVTAVLNNFLVLRALAIDVPAAASFFVLVVLQAGIALPSAPGRIGIFQYLCVLALGVFAIEQTAALSYGVLLHAVVFLPTVLLGVILLWTSSISLRRQWPAQVGDPPGMSS